MSLNTREVPRPVAPVLDAVHDGCEHNLLLAGQLPISTVSRDLAWEGDILAKYGGFILLGRNFLFQLVNRLNGVALDGECAGFLTGSRWVVRLESARITLIRILGL